MALWTTAELLSDVKLHTMLPSNDLVITDANILSFATGNIMALMAPIINSARSAYYLRVYDQTVSSSTNVYPIPDRALGGRIENLLLVDGSGRETSVQVVDYAEDLARDTGPGSRSQYVAYVRDNSVIFVFAPSNAVTVRMVYYSRPGTLITTSDARQLTAVGGSSITMSSALTGLSTGVQFDIISNKPIFSARGIDQTGTVASNVITMTPPTGTAIGDWVALANYSPIPQVPYELQTVLIQMTAADVLGALGDVKGMEIMDQGVAELLSQVLQLISPRVAGNPAFIVNNNWPHSRRGRGRYWGY